MTLVKQHLSYANHKETFSNIKYQNIIMNYQTDTELSNEYCNIISANKTSNIS